MDWNNVPRDWDDPYWLDTQQPDSWRHCISEDIQEIWATFTELQKQTLAADAQKRADNTKTSEGSSGNERRELMQLRLRERECCKLMFRRLPRRKRSRGL